MNVRSAALHPVVRARVSGANSGSATVFPLIPGADGVGYLDDGARVSFALVRPPYGTLAARSVVPREMTFPLPDRLDDLTAAAVFNPAQSSWFYPLDWEPLSRDQLALVQKFADEFARHGARVFSISVDSIFCHAAFARESQLHFPLLADFQPRGAVARQYGVYRDGQGVSARALFVLDRQGRIRFSRAYPDFFNPGVDDLLTTLEALVVEDADEAKRTFALAFDLFMC